MTGKWIVRQLSDFFDVIESERLVYLLSRCIIVDGWTFVET